VKVGVGNKETLQPRC